MARKARSASLSAHQPLNPDHVLNDSALRSYAAVCGKELGDSITTHTPTAPRTATRLDRLQFGSAA